jgi:ATP-dependent RNA helicase DeaD
VYGGQDYSVQLRQLRRGVHVVVGTPGRVMDHMRRGTLKLDGLQALVLDEADEMLRMGFIEEVEWILEQTPSRRQMALFSATMPREVERIARRHLHDPQEISIESKAATAETIRQRYWLVGGLHKLDALTRILEVEPHDGILIFVRTRIATSELAERLEARGYAAAAMNGDMPQNQREKMVSRLKSGSLDILVATDVAARGLDVDRISHVINYDIPYDTEAYIHRIGRTGRAGRQGDAILFVAPRERRMLHAIERATRQKIEPLELPTTETVNNKRIADFKQRISDTLATGDLAFMQSIVEQYQQDHDVPALEIASALANMSIGDRPLLLDPAEEARARRNEGRSKRADSKQGKRDRPNVRRSDQRADRNPRERNQRPPPSGTEMEQFRIEVGQQHEVEPRNIVGAIANEAGVDAEHIGRIDIQAEFSLVELPTGMPKAIFKDLKKVWVCGRQLNISRVNEPDAGASAKPGRTPRKRVGNHTAPRTSSRRPVSPDARGSKARAQPKDQRGKKRKSQRT